MGEDVISQRTAPTSNVGEERSELRRRFFAHVIEYPSCVGITQDLQAQESLNIDFSFRKDVLASMCAVFERPPIVTEVYIQTQRIVPTQLEHSY